MSGRVDERDIDRLVFDPPELGCVLYMPGLPGGGSSIYDRSPYGNHGTIVGPTWRREPSGLCGLSFDGDDYVNIDAVVADIAADTKGTWMTWVKLDDATPAGTSILIALSDTDTTQFIRLLISSAGILKAQAFLAGNSKIDLTTDAAPLSDGIYSHLAIIQDGVSPILLVNGVQVAQTFNVEVDKTLWMADCAGIDNGRIGCGNHGGIGNQDFVVNGDLDLEKFIRTNLTVAQVLNIFNQERHLFNV